MYKHSIDSHELIELIELIEYSYGGNTVHRTYNWIQLYCYTSTHKIEIIFHKFLRNKTSEVKQSLRSSFFFEGGGGWIRRNKQRTCVWF